MGNDGRNNSAEWSLNNSNSPKGVRFDARRDGAAPYIKPNFQGKKDRIFPTNPYTPHTDRDPFIFEDNFRSKEREEGEK